MNEQILTRQEIEQRFDGERVLVDEAEIDENLEVVRGIVLVVPSIWAHTYKT